MQELELAMIDLKAAQSRTQSAEVMLDKAKSGMLGIDYEHPSPSSTSSNPAAEIEREGKGDVVMAT